MFCGEFAEAKDGQSKVTLPAVTIEGLQLVLDAIYSRHLILLDSNILDILDTADQLEVQEILDCCEDFLTNGLDSTNCMEMLQISDKYTLVNLNQAIESLFIAQFTNASQHPLFYMVPKEAIIELICDNAMDCNEIDIYRGAMRWARPHAQDEHFATDLQEILQHIGFTYISASKIRREIMQDPLICENSPCMDLIQTALEYVVDYERDFHSQPLKDVKNTEKPRGKVVAIAIVPENITDENEIMKLNVPAAKKIPMFGLTSEGGLNLSDCSYSYCSHSIAVFSMNVLQVGNSLFLLGAVMSEERSPDKNVPREEAKSSDDAEMRLYRFDGQTGLWSQLSNPPFPPRVVSASVVHNNDIYVIGGASYSTANSIPFNTFQKTCFRYNIATNKWMEIADYPHPVSHPAACSLGDLVYVVGGGGPPFDTWMRDFVYAFDPDKNNWIRKSNLVEGRAGHRVCVVDGKIYTLGGRDPSRRDVPICEVYNPQDDSWLPLDSAPIPHSVASYSLLVSGSKIILLGGGDDQDNHPTIMQTLDTSSLTWTQQNWKDLYPDLMVFGSTHFIPTLQIRDCAKAYATQITPVQNTNTPKPQDSGACAFPGEDLVMDHTNANGMTNLDETGGGFDGEMDITSPGDASECQNDTNNTTDRKRGKSKRKSKQCRSQ